MAISSEHVNRLLSGAALFVLTVPVSAQEWPQWRGPNRDGVVHGVTLPAKWPKTLTQEWTVSVGRGVASPVVVGRKVWVFTRIKDDELVLCLDLSSGKEIWRSEPYFAPYTLGGGEDQPTAEHRPRSTPAVAGGNLYTLGMSGIVSCLNADSGKLLWRKSHKALPYGGTSPLVVDGLCIVHVGDGKTGGLTAFDAQTGEVKWCYADGSRHGAGSPILVDLAGERQVVTAASGGLLGVSVATGKRLWGTSGLTSNCTPVRHKDLLIVAPDREPLRAIRLEKDARGLAAKEVWKAKGHPLYYSSPVLVGDRLFGMSVGHDGHFFCLDATTGQTLWEGPARLGLTERRDASASLVTAGNVLLFLTDGGRLLVVDPAAATYQSIMEYHVSDTQTGAHPVFLGDRILIRDAATLRSFRIVNEAK